MNIFQEFIEGMKQTTTLEYIAVIFGIVSVWYSRMENILVYPVGLVNTIPYIFLSMQAHLFGEATVNIYYTIINIYGWILWARKDKENHPLVYITKSDRRQWTGQLLFFFAFYIVIFLALSYLKKYFTSQAIPWADALASASAFTGMWLMAKKKVESWYWWIITNIASIPLYFVKHLVFSSVYYLILLVMAFWGLAEWLKKSREHDPRSRPVILPAQEAIFENNS